MSQLKDRRSDNVLPVQGYRTSEGAVVDEYVAMVELRKITEIRRGISHSVTPSKTYLT
jgi:hypothetical protein